MRKLFYILLLTATLSSCSKTYEVIVPDSDTWKEFTSPAARPLNTSCRNTMEGVYKLTSADDFFGELVAVKWNYNITGNDTNFHVSGFFGKDIAYFICEGKQLNGEILLNGYWRKMVSTETGLIRLTIAAADGAVNLLGPAAAVDSGGIRIKGVYGFGQLETATPIAFSYARQLNKSPSNFQILAHRSGGRTSDLLPVSENSVPMILKTPEFGSTGIEIDVQFTKDGVPILYHDVTVNLRETQKSGLVGPIKNYTYEQLFTFVRLTHGEKIPTLREALDAVINQTDLRFVWLDTKFVGSIVPVAAIQKEYLQKAAARGRQLEIVIGLPGQEQVDNFIAMPAFENSPALCELTLEDVEKTKAKIWAPRFTEGTQNEKVDLIHAQGKRAFSWTVDVPEFIKRFVNDGNFDGLLSNYPSCVAYHYYVHE